MEFEFITFSVNNCESIHVRRYLLVHVQHINSLTGSWVYEYGASRYKTIFFWDFTFTFMEIPPELIGRVDPTEPIMWVLSFLSSFFWRIEIINFLHGEYSCSYLYMYAYVCTCKCNNLSNFFCVFLQKSSVCRPLGDREALLLRAGRLGQRHEVVGRREHRPSIRAVMAGGRHVNVPCAHAAHCALEGSKKYRSRHSPAKNYRRVVETLFSPKYKETFYYYNPLWQVRHKFVTCTCTCT